MTNTPDISSTPGQVPTNKGWKNFLIAGAIAATLTWWVIYVTPQAPQYIGYQVDRVKRLLGAESVINGLHKYPGSSLTIGKDGKYLLTSTSRKPNSVQNKKSAKPSIWSDIKITDKSTWAQKGNYNTPDSHTGIIEKWWPLELIEENPPTISRKESQWMQTQNTTNWTRLNIVKNEKGYQEYLQSLPTEVRENMPALSYIQSQLGLQDKFDIKFILQPGDIEVWVYGTPISSKENTKEYDEVKAHEPYRLRIWVIDTNKKTFTSNPSDYFHYTTDKK